VVRVREEDWRMVWAMVAEEAVRKRKLSWDLMVARPPSAGITAVRGFWKKEERRRERSTVSTCLAWLDLRIDSRIDWGSVGPRGRVKVLGAEADTRWVRRDALPFAWSVEAGD